MNVISRYICTLWDLLGVVVANTVCTRRRQIPLLISLTLVIPQYLTKPLEIDPYLLLDTNRKSYMANSAHATGFNLERP